MFRRISPIGITSDKKKKKKTKKNLKKHVRLGHAGIVDHSVDLSIKHFNFS